MIPYGRQEITQADLDAVSDVLRSDFLTQGPAVPRFEAAVSARVSATHAVAVNSATSALHIACMALGLGRGDRLWTVPNTFVASANCARYCEADVDFVDINPDTLNLDPACLRDKLARAKAQDRLPKIVVPVHFGGQPTDQEAIWDLAREYGFRVVEDASHSVGSARHGEPVGSCAWSDITIFSFHPVKIITTAEGGMALTNEGQVAERMRLLRSHGITRDPAAFRGRLDARAGDGPGAPAFYYEQHLLGFNYRMTDIQAALGLSQLERLDGYVQRRNDLARRYDHLLRDVPVKRQTVVAGNRSAFHLYVVRVTPGSGRSRRSVFDGLRAAGIGVNVHYLPVHLQPYYRDLGFFEGQFPEAEAYGAEAITLPLFPSMTDLEQDRVVRELEALL